MRKKGRVIKQKYDDTILQFSVYETQDLACRKPLSLAALTETMRGVGTPSLSIEADTGGSVAHCQIVISDITCQQTSILIPENSAGNLPQTFMSVPAGEGGRIYRNTTIQ
jgi:hypothetical protein